MAQAKKFKIVGRFVYSRRERVGLSQMALAKAIGCTTAQSVSNIERGLAGIPRGKIREIAKALKVSTESVLAVMAKQQKESLKCYL